MPHSTYTVDVRMFWHVAHSLVLRRGGPEHHLRRARGIVPENKGREKKETPSCPWYQYLRMYVCRIPAKLDRNAFRSKTELVFWRVEKAEHQGCCVRIPPESGRNRNPALDYGTPKTGTKAGMCKLGQERFSACCDFLILAAVVVLRPP